jgi:hypothetical protein
MHNEDVKDLMGCVCCLSVIAFCLAALWGAYALGRWAALVCRGFLP